MANTNNQINEKQMACLRIPVQAHFTPPLKLKKKKVEGVMAKKGRTIVKCRTADNGKIVLRPVIEEAISFGGDQVRKPDYCLFTSEAGGPEPVWSSTVTDQVASWQSGFSRLICGPNGEKLAGFMRQEGNIGPQKPRVLFRAKELCRIDVRYSRDGRFAYLTISKHQIVDGDNPRYQVEILAEGKFNLYEDYLDALGKVLESNSLEDFEVPATIALEMGYKFPNGARPKSSALRDHSNRERATVPTYFKYSQEEQEVVAEETAEEKSSPETLTIEAEPVATTAKPSSKKKSSGK